MKILVFMPKYGNGNEIDYAYIFPVGLAYISATLKSAGHTVTCINLNHHAGDTEQIVRAHLATAPAYDMICTGGLSSHYAQMKRIVSGIRISGANSIVVLGGGLVTSEPELIFNALHPDFVVLGEGEETIKELALALEQQRDTSAIAGIGYRGADGRFVKTVSRDPIMDLDAVPWPDFAGFEYNVWLDNLKPTNDALYDCYDFPRAYPIISSRSCPCRCTFCFHPLGNKYRQRSIDSVIQELEAIIPRFRINIINIDDECFSHRIERIYEFCEKITVLSKKLSWDLKWICSMRVEGLSEDVLVTMKNAGCIGLGFGFESYSPIVLKSMKKHITPDQIKRAVELTLAHHISTFSFFIFGDRVETVETMRQTLDFCRSIRCANVDLLFVTPYPGTEIYNYCVEQGIIKNRLTYIEDGCGLPGKMAEHMSDDEYWESFVRIRDARIRWSIRASPSSVCKDANGTYTLTVTCPHCGQKIKYANYPLPDSTLYSIWTNCRSCRRMFWMSSKKWLLLAKTVLVLFSIIPMRLKTQLFKHFSARHRACFPAITKFLSA